MAVQYIASADGELAAQRLADARWALNQTEDELPADVKRNATAHIETAEQTLNNATGRINTTASTSTDSYELQASAIRQFGETWTEATKALYAIDTATAPEVTITTRGDPQREDGDPIDGEIRGTVFDVRPNELITATVTIAGDETKTVPIEPTARRANATFAANVTLEDRITSVDVEVTDDVPRAESAADVPKTDSDTVLFDGDGLPDTYETNIVGTDPQDPDSDTPQVSEDVSDNGVIDGLENFDDDNLSTYHEGRFGSDPFQADTDDDGLPDHFEVQYPELDQTRADTTGDGVSDAEWDIDDDDGLTNLEEYEAGTNPQLADRDRDGLEDDRELEVGTDPDDPDTDDDGLSDGEEVELGTDPLAADSDGDGVTDGQQSHTTSANNESLGVDISITGDGNVAKNVTIEENGDERFETDAVTSARASPILELESEHEFDRANVTVEYDETAVDDDETDQLAVFRFNETTQTFEPLPSSVDPENGTVTGETTQFSTFAVFHVGNWLSQFETQTPGESSGNETDTPETAPVDTLFVIDTPGSMSGNDPNGYRKVAAKRFVGALIDGDRAGVVDFDSTAHVEQGLTTDFDAVNSSIDRLDASGGTDIGDGMRAANSHFASASNDSRAKITVFLTDGNGGGGPAEAETAAERNITVYTIGFGSADDSKLKSMAQTTGGEYNHVDSSEELPEVFSRVAENATGGTDTDGDSLPDAVERQGIRTGTGEVLDTDPDDNDSDGDGLEDGEEIDKRFTAELNGSDTGTNESGNYTYYTLRSDPTDVDADDDGIDDYTETENATNVVRTTDRDATQQVLETGGEDPSAIDAAYDTYDAYSDPLEADTDGDGIDDARERELATDPSDSDTDGDGIDDQTELDGAGDPTLYDIRPPEIDVQNSGYHIPELSLDTDYWVYYHVEDPAGVDRVALRKAGSERESKSYGGDTSVYDSMEFTEELAGSETDVDTSRVKSTFVSGFKKGAETVGSVGESVGDTVAGTTVYVEANDRNGNQNDAIGVRRANFYSEVAGDLYTGTIIDQAVASEFGTVSGFSSSLGVVFQDISQFIDDPGAVVEGVEILIDLAEEEGLGAGQTLVEVMVQNVQQKQAVNNPYGSLEEKDHPELYETFRENWYGGYAAGFLAKTALGGAASSGAKSTIKSTDAVQSAGSKLADTKALKALNRVSDAKEAAKGRATARILLAVDGDAAEPLLSQADTAGGAYRLWRQQRAMDADIDAMPESHQARLARTLPNADSDAQSAIRQMDQDALDDLTSLDIDARTRADLAPTYSKLDAENRQRVDELIDQHGTDGGNLVSKLDADPARKVLQRPCSRSFASISSASADSVSLLSAAQSCDLTEQEWKSYQETLTQTSTKIDSDAIGQTANVLRNTDRPSAVIDLFDDPRNTSFPSLNLKERRTGASNWKISIRTITTE